MARSTASGLLERAPFSASALTSSIAQAIGQSRDHLILQLEQVGDVFLEAVGPEMRAGVRIDELGVDAHAVLVALHRAFEHIAHAELLADILGVDVLALEGEGGVAGDHEAVADARQVGRQILRNAVGEIVLGGIAERLVKGSTTMERCAASAGASSGGASVSHVGGSRQGNTKRRPRSR